MRSLKKTKKDLEMQLKDQEEELDDLAAQVVRGRGRVNSLIWRRKVFLVIGIVQ